MRAVLLLALLAACQTTPELGMTPAQVEAIWGEPDVTIGPVRADWHNWPMEQLEWRWRDERVIRCVVFLMDDVGLPFEASGISYDRKRR